MTTKEEYHKKRREYFAQKKIEKQLELFKKGWKKNYRKANNLGWQKWSFMKQLEFALKLIKSQEDFVKNKNGKRKRIL